MHLSTFWIAFIATATLSALGLIYLMIGWARKRSGRVLLRGAGFVLVPIGLMVMGWMELGVDGVRYLIDWSNNHTMTLRIEAGLAVAGVGLVLYLIGSFMAPIIGDAARARRAEIVAKKAARQAPATSSVPKSLPAAAPGAGAGTATAPAKAVATTDPAGDDEIDAILRRHGIQ